MRVVSVIFFRGRCAQAAERVEPQLAAIPQVLGGPGLGFAEAIAGCAELGPQGTIPLGWNPADLSPLSLQLTNHAIGVFGTLVRQLEGPGEEGFDM